MEGNQTNSPWGSWQNAEFFIEAGGTRSPNSYPHLTWGELKSLMARMGLNSNLSPLEMMGQVRFVVRLPRGLQDKIITFQTYDDSGNQAQRSTVLLPPFNLDPTQYQQSQPSVLFEFHPFKAMVGQNISGASLLESHRQFCID